jgi:hypothetical protein
MARYLISFDDGAMTFPDEELPEVAAAAHAVVREAKDAGVWVFGGGIDYAKDASVVTTDGTATDAPFPRSSTRLGGFSIIDVSTRQEALGWAAKIAAACRCPQDVRELMDDSEV